MAMLMTNLFTLAHAAPDIPEALGPNTLIGTVTLDSGGGVPNARVISIQSSSRRAATTANTGNYLMSGLITGTYSVNVVPVTITTTSPTWVYTGGAQLIDFASAIPCFTAFPASLEPSVGSKICLYMGPPDC